MNTDLAPRPVARVYALPLVTSPASFFSSPDILDYTGISKLESLLTGRGSVLSFIRNALPAERQEAEARMVRMVQAPCGRV